MSSLRTPQLLILRTTISVVVFILVNVYSNAQTINFSGYTWNVKNTTGGPGPNRYDPNNVWLDANGNLHLAIKKDVATGQWSCAELSTLNKLAAGVYQFWVEGRIDQLNKNVVLGLFDYGEHDGWDENDIEYARWGNDSNDNLNYTVYPAYGTVAGSQTFHQNISLNTINTTQRFTRSYDHITFQSLAGFTDDNSNQFASHTFNNRPITLSKTDMRVHINLWLFQGNAPTDGNNVEIILHQFKFTSNSCIESFEPNDSNTIAPDLFTAPLGATVNSKMITSVISDGLDQDWYKIPIEASGKLDMALTTLPTDYNLELYTSNGLLACSYHTGTTSETISYNYRSQVSTSLYVKIYPANISQANACNNYTLSVNWSPQNFNSTDSNPFELKVSPNPGQGEFLLTGQGVLNKSILIVINEISGRQVYLKQFTPTTSAVSEMIDLGRIASGIYFATVRIEERTCVIKLVKY